MGTGNFTNQADGEVANASDVQQTIDALKEDQVPRNSAGVPTADSGEIGTAAFPFKKANVSSGFFFTGMIMPMHTYNGAITPGQGWFPCSGAVINETAYDNIHGAGSWATFVGSSALDGLYSPNMAGKYLTGVSTTSQDGTAAITTVGNPGSLKDLEHSHTGPAHTHKWYDYISDFVSSVTYDASGVAKSIAGNTKQNGAATSIRMQTGALTNSLDEDNHTTSAGTGSTGNALSFVEDIRPDSLEVQYYIRIV